MLAKETDNQTRALKLLSRKNGATVEQITEQLGLPVEKKARGLIDRLRAKGVPIENVGPHRFKVIEQGNPRVVTATSGRKRGRKPGKGGNRLRTAS